jgi:hypothetical protein
MLVSTSPASTGSTSTPMSRTCRFGGGWRSHGRGWNRVGGKRARIGYGFIHSTVDAHSRLAYCEIHDDEQALTAIAFFSRAKAFFEAHGISIERVLTDNGSCYRSRDFEAKLVASAVVHTFTRPYRPATNGKVERFNRTLLDEWAYARAYGSESARKRALDAWAASLQPSSAPHRCWRPAHQPREQRRWAIHLDRQFMSLSPSSATPVARSPRSASNVKDGEAPSSGRIRPDGAAQDRLPLLAAMRIGSIVLARAGGSDLAKPIWHQARDTRTGAREHSSATQPWRTDARAGVPSQQHRHHGCRQPLDDVPRPPKSTPGNRPHGAAPWSAPSFARGPAGPGVTRRTGSVPPCGGTPSSPLPRRPLGIRGTDESCADRCRSLSPRWPAGQPRL